ncbi:hypothetical protein NE235_23565 [Actinoallomurus spadix]|uniref:hypothetical protein n=1 Tax=Actinoallomurus spadix TaxID=79912 RepID=UPI0020925234|nr:hypothetical protein [Actinoallomurus spadix]MCO5989090.1 hypothetical protein [Actinoallomurus spadix]
MRDRQDRTDERARPLPGDRPVAGVPVTGADEGRGRTAAEDRDTEPDKIILSSRTEDEQRSTTGSGRDDSRASQVVPGGPADPLGERTAGPTATARPYAPGGSPASTAPVATPDPGATADGSGPGATPDTAAERLIRRDDADRFSSRWREVKAGFVDDPRDAVKQAGALCEEAVTALTGALADQQRGLRDRWNGDADTERLRTALRAYGDLLDRLTSL